MVAGCGDAGKPRRAMLAGPLRRRLTAVGRATFITLTLANRRTEAWVQDRTGHKSSLMLNLYRRAARTAAELGLGDLLPLDTAIPELAGQGTPRAESSALPKARPFSLSEILNNLAQ